MTLLATIGLEVHAQLKTQTKLFCRCPNQFGGTANTRTCPVCLGLPGALPVFNQEVANLALRLGLALGCEPQTRSIFARKNYFYPDLPKGYQISQFENPLCLGGAVEFQLEGKTHRASLERIHLEEDAGKLLHGDSLHTQEGSLIDLNRAGVPLIEIVGKPELHSGKEAGEYLRSLRSIVRYTEVGDGNMEEGSFRCDANVSVAPADQNQLGEKVEVKNLNSFKHVQLAIDFEIARQTLLLQQGKKIPQETRLWHESKQETLSMRSKEDAHDYRYFPEPDLPPLIVSEAQLTEARNSLPELPRARKQRFLSDLGLSDEMSRFLAQEKSTADFFEATLKHLPAKKSAIKVGNFIRGELTRVANDQNVLPADAGLPPAHLAEIVGMVEEGSISEKMSKTLLLKVIQQGASPRDVAKTEGMGQVSDEGQLKTLVQKVVSANPEQKAAYQSGKEKLFGFFVGQVMKESGGKANPQVVNQLLKAELAHDD